MGTIRFVGEVPEVGEGIVYGIEFTDGSIGQSDGTFHGKRYFSTDGKRAYFTQEAKIRRKLTSKDRKKHDSLRLMQEHKIDSPANGAPTTENVKTEENEKREQEENEKTDPEDNGGLSPITEKQPVPSEVDKLESVAHENNGDEDAPQKSPVREETSDSKVAEPSSNSVKHVRRSSRSNTLTKTSSGISAAEAYESLLTFILRQSEDLREQLLDVYSHPQLNVVLINAYAELKNMEKDEQEKIWNALLTRWKRFI